MDIVVFILVTRSTETQIDGSVSKAFRKVQTVSAKTVHFSIRGNIYNIAGCIISLRFQTEGWFCACLIPT